MILAYDLGTSGLKASLVAADGALLGSASAGYETVHTEAGAAEQDPESWWAGIRKATRELRQRYPEEKIEAIGLSGHMLGCVPVDSIGRALRPAMIHSDGRAIEEESLVKKVFGGADAVYEKTGSALNAKSTLCKVLWIKKHEPEVYKAAAKFLQCKDYIAARLTGNIDTTDFSDASHGQLLDIRKKRYLDEFAQLALDKDKFPEVHKSADIVGYVTDQAAKELMLTQGIPVTAGGGDGACANVGAGIWKQGDAYCSLGTTAWIAYYSREPVLDPGKRIFDIMSLDGESFGVFGTTEAAGRSVEWIREHFGLSDLESLNRMAKTVPAGCGGLVYLPYLEGERSPIFDAKAKAMFFGMRSFHTPAYFMRSVLEGTAFALRSILEVQREYVDIEAMRLIGGGANSRLWTGIIADSCQVNLELLSGASVGITSLGAAMAAAVGIGLCRDYSEAAGSMQVRETVSYEETDCYEANYRIYGQLYPRLKDLF